MNMKLYILNYAGSQKQRKNKIEDFYLHKNFPRIFSQIFQIIFVLFYTLHKTYSGEEVDG